MCAPPCHPNRYVRFLVDLCVFSSCPVPHLTQWNQDRHFPREPLNMLCPFFYGFPANTITVSDLWASPLNINLYGAFWEELCACGCLETLVSVRLNGLCELFCHHESIACVVIPVCSNCSQGQSQFSQGRCACQNSDSGTLADPGI